MKMYKSVFKESQEDYSYQKKFYMSGMSGIKFILFDILQDLSSDISAQGDMNDYDLIVGNFENTTNGIIFFDMISGKQSIILKYRNKPVVVAYLIVTANTSSISQIYIEGTILKNKKDFKVTFIG